MSIIKFLAKALSLAIFALVLPVSPAQATNCSSVTGTSLSQNSNLWIFQWDALTDTSNIDGLNIFVTSGSEHQSWYNNVSGRYWDGLPSSATMYLVNKNGLIYFMNEQDISEITFSVRKDNGAHSCYPLTTIGTITPSRLSTPSNIQVSQIQHDKALITFSSNPMAASNTLTLTPTNGGTPRVITEFNSGTEIAGLLASTRYSVSIKSLGGIANINSVSATSEFATLQDPVEVARLAYLAKLAEVAQAKTDIQASVKSANNLTLEVLAKAEIKGATKDNLPLINKELAQLSIDKRGNFTEILKVIRKFEVVDILASSDKNKVQAKLLIEIGLLASDSKNKTTLVNAVRSLSPERRSTYEAIQAAIKLEMQAIQARKDRFSAIQEKIKNRG